MKSFVMATALVCGLASGEFLNERNLQAIPPPPPPPPPVPQYTSTTRALKYYGDDIKITWRATLGCGACITGGYTYCFMGQEGQDYSNVALTQTCCVNSTTAGCSVINNPAYTCSNKYSDKMLAKNICPYQSSKCGGKGQAFRFNTWGDSTKNALSLALSNGDTCSLIINTQCGVPAFTVGDTTGFQIESIDYNDDEATRRRRVLGAFDDEGDVYDQDNDLVDLSSLDFVSF
jgi:hypothetical protein